MRINMRFEGRWMLLFLVALVLQQNVVSSKSFETDVQLTKQYIVDKFVPEITDVLTQFDNILVPDVNPPASVPYCSVPTDDLQDIQNVFTASIGTDRIPAITMSSSSQCSEVSKMRSAILKLKLDLYKLLKQISSLKYVEEKADYLSKIRDLKKRMVDVSKTVSDTDKDIVTKLLSDLETQETIINAILVKLEDKKKELRDNAFGLCVANLQLHRIDAALADYKELNDKTVIKEIIAAAYENVDSFKTLFNFIKSQKDSMSVLNGFVGLFDAMKAKNHVNIKNLIIFVNGVSKYHGLDFDDLTKALYNSFSDANYDQFFEFYNGVNHRDYHVAFGFDTKELMQIFVRGTLNKDVKNVVKVLDMKSRFGAMEERLALLTAMMHEMLSSEHLINSPEMMILIHDIMEIRQEVDAQYSVVNKQTVNELYNSVPDALKSLMYNNMCIRNINNGDYVYAGPVLDESRRNLFTTKRIELTTPNDATFVFHAQFIDRGRKLLFKNTFGEHLYFVSGASPRQVLSWTKGSMESDTHAYFTVERTDEMSVRVRSVEYKEYMYAEADTLVAPDAHHVNVYAGVGAEARWAIETCPFHYNI